MRQAQTAGGPPQGVRPLVSPRARRRGILAAAAFCLIPLLAGCVATQEDLQTARSEMTTTTATLQQQFVDFKTATENRQGDAENRLAAIEERLATIETAAGRDRASVAEAIDAVKTDVRVLAGKVSEIEFTLKDALEKAVEEQDRKNFDVRKDIEALKTAQNNLFGSMTALNKNVTEGLTGIQNDLLALKNAQLQFKNSLEQHLADTTRMETEAIAERVRAALKTEMMEEFDKKVGILLAEVVRQESELAQVKEALERLESKTPPPPKTTGTVPAVTGSAKPATGTVTGTSTAATRSAAPAATIYVVKSGDSFESVARKFNITVQKLKAVNPKSSARAYLLIGERLIIPK